MRSKYFLRHCDVFLMVFTGIMIIIGILPKRTRYFVPEEEASAVLGLNTQEEKWRESDSLLTYNDFKLIQLDIRGREQGKKRQDEGNIVRGKYLGVWGVAEGSASSDMFTQNEQGKRYYLTLNDFALRHDISRFAVVNGVRQIRYVNEIPHEEHVLEYGKPVVVNVPYIFSTETNKRESFAEKKNGRVLIEISKMSHKVLGVVMWGGFLLLIIYCYVIFALPLKIVIRISQGKAFSEKNVRSLHIIAVTLLAMSWGGIVLRFILQFIFRNTLTDEVFVPVRALLQESLASMVIAIAVLATAKAFKKGLSLQKEQEFTI